MPTSDSGDNNSSSNRRGGDAAAAAAAQQQQAPAPLACPRCDSANTKFCYYNNYNLSQPRHFCKSCRRYWTHGGTLRDVPVGGGSRKNSKRSRSSSSSASAAAAASSASSSSEAPLFSHMPVPSDPPPAKPDPSPSPGEGVLGFTSLLNSQAPGFLALGGYGYGLDEMGFGYGSRPGVWPFVDQVGGGDFGGGGGGGGGGGSGVACNTWQMSGGSEGGLVDSVDCFSWPDLSISMPGNGLK